MDLNQSYNRRTLDAITLLQPEQLAWTQVLDSLRQSIRLSELVHILNQANAQREGRPLEPLTDRPLREVLILRAIARTALASLDQEREDAALDRAAEVMCEGEYGEYSPMADQDVRVQAKYRRWAKAVISAYFETLTERV